MREDPPKLRLAQKSKSRYCLDSKGTGSSCRRDTPADAGKATVIAYQSDRKSPVFSALDQRTATINCPPHRWRSANLSMQPASGTLTGRLFRGSGKHGRGPIPTGRAARKGNGGFKRLLQQELLDQFDRLSER